jgi:hypothetical protein
MGRKGQFSYTPEQARQWFDDYNRGMSYPEISQRRRFGIGAVYGALKRAGIAFRGMRARKLASLGVSYREDCFDTPGPDRDYHVGFIMADGCVEYRNGPNRPCIQVRIAEVDIEYLQELLRFVGAPEKHICISDPVGRQRQRSLASVWCRESQRARK